MLLDIQLLIAKNNTEQKDIFCENIVFPEGQTECFSLVQLGNVSSD